MCFISKWACKQGRERERGLDLNYIDEGWLMDVNGEVCHRENLCRQVKVMPSGGLQSIDMLWLRSAHHQCKTWWQRCLRMPRPALFQSQKAQKVSTDCTRLNSVEKNLPTPASLRLSKRARLPDRMLIVSSESSKVGPPDPRVKPMRVGCELWNVCVEDYRRV